jgi:hypothetical protein
MKNGFLFILTFYCAILIQLLDNFSFFIPFKFILFDQISFKNTRYNIIKVFQIPNFFLSSSQKTYNLNFQYNSNNSFNKKFQFLENNKNTILFSIKIIKKDLKFKYKTKLSSSLLKITKLTRHKSFFSILLCIKNYRYFKKINLNILFKINFFQKLYNYYN